MRAGADQNRRGVVKVTLSVLVIAGLILAGLTLVRGPGGRHHQASRAQLSRFNTGNNPRSASRALRAAVGKTIGQSWDDIRAGTDGNHKGYSVAIADKTAVVGAPGTSDYAGLAYVYHESGSTWHQVATLKDPRRLPGDEYSWAVAISITSAGSYIAVGGNDTNGKRDYVYIYQGSGAKWRLVSKVGDIGTTSQDMFGDALALSGNLLVIGASCRFYNIGATYILQRFGPDWRLRSSLRAPDSHEKLDFGESLSISGSTVLAGSNDGAYIYDKQSDDKWALATSLANPGPASDLFGMSVSLSGSTAIVGAPEAENGPGEVYDFTLSAGTWSLTNTLATIPGINGGEFGWSVALSGNELLIGMPYYGTQAGISCGTALVFKRSGTTWAGQGELADQDCGNGDKFGFSVAATTTTAVIGAPYTDKNAGAAYLRALSTAKKPASSSYGSGW
jgi:hypothetical protein